MRPVVSRVLPAGCEWNDNQTSRTGLINPQNQQSQRMRPAAEAGLMLVAEAANLYMRPVLGSSPFS